MDETASPWGDFFRNITGTVVGAAVNARYTQPFLLEQQRIDAARSGGAALAGVPMMQPGTVAGIGSGTLLLVGAAVVLVLLLRD